jgi:hypothetical protein
MILGHLQFVIFVPVLKECYRHELPCPFRKESEKGTLQTNKCLPVRSGRPAASTLTQRSQSIKRPPLSAIKIFPVLMSQ